MGVKLAITDITAVGGIPGITEVKLDDLNQRDEGRPSLDQLCAEVDALFSGGVDAVIGAQSSEASRKVIDKIVSAGVIMISPSNTSPMFSTYDDQGRYFRTSPSDIFQGAALASEVVYDGNRTAVAISPDDAYGNPLREVVTSALEQSGVRVLDSFSYDPSMENYGREVQRIKASEPEAIILISGGEGVRILQAMIEQGLAPQNARMYGTDGTLNDNLAQQVNSRAPSILAGMKGTKPPVGNAEFMTRLHQSAPTVRDFTYAAQAYDAVIITALAAAIAGTDDPSAVAQEINGVTKDGDKCASFKDCLDLVMAGTNIDYDGVSGPLEFTDSGEPCPARYLIVEFQHDGRLQPRGDLTPKVC